MTNREQEILNIIRNKPMISQNELAEAMGITRSSVAVHITNLMKKGFILGKGYILQEKQYVCVIGGSNVDIQGFPDYELIYRDSNVGKVKISFGGAGRNTAENLVKLGVDTRLISVIGDDAYGQKMLEEARQSGLNMQDTVVLPGESTSTYLSILDSSRDMILAISSMEIYNRMTVEFIKTKKHIIENAALCILDTNIPEDVLEYVLTTFTNTDFFLDTVSTTKARKAKDLIGFFHTVKPNKIEAEILSGIIINDDTDLKKAAAVFHEKGVKRVFITLGENGVYYSNGKVSRRINTPKVKIINATGAGDAFLAALAYGYLDGMDDMESIKLAMAASHIALSHENTINPGMCLKNLLDKAKELEKC